MAEAVTNFADVIVFAMTKVKIFARFCRCALMFADMAKVIVSFADAVVFVETKVVVLAIFCPCCLIFC